jgi:hypothetical protein
MLYNRQKQLLALLATLGGREGALDFQKLLFLFCQEAEESPSYAFVPYRFGAFSFTSYADKRRLVTAGILGDSSHTWQLTEMGRSTEKRIPIDRMRFNAFAGRYASLRGDALVAETYRRYPYFAIRSEILGQLGLEPAVLKRIEAVRPPLARGQLSTIGYEGRCLEEYLNLLLRAGVTLLCDVRRNPLSRKYGFSKKSLANACAGVGIRYEHLPELGIESENRKGLMTEADYHALFARYRRDWLPNQPDALSRVLKWIRDGESVALTCYEHRAQLCHRHCVAEAVLQTGGDLGVVRHL